MVLHHELMLGGESFSSVLRYHVGEPEALYFNGADFALRNQLDGDRAICFKLQTQFGLSSENWHKSRSFLSVPLDGRLDSFLLAHAKLASTVVDFCMPELTFHLGHWEDVIVSRVKAAIPESVEQTWHDWRDSVKQAKHDVTSKDHIDEAVEMAGWGVQEATENNRKDASKFMKSQFPFILPLEREALMLMQWI